MEGWYVIVSTGTTPGRVDLVRGMAELLCRDLAPDRIVTDLTRLKAYECDGITGHRVIPALVALPECTAEVAAVVAACACRVPLLHPVQLIDAEIRGVDPISSRGSNHV
ncbi:hypothetical protein M1247_09575 [Mycobacterium sp. 21AC1]|uniref:hypothetical protein n=1 Tax=[Mycobacterium] appelbergii TaxID=2939269 RepID=UPI002938DB1B|nr:hypothetical protein [Mycobacterium sp. 21AC1]MDV3125157.1 hypothetical protein [Mycobacterium sp. 21AC1]